MYTEGTKNQHYMSKTTYALVAFAAIFLFAGQGCETLMGGKPPLPPNGGLYATENSGQTWQHRVLIPTVSGQPGSIATVNVRSMTLDPSDKKSVYMGTAANGMVYSYDQGKTWNQPQDIRAGSVYDITVDPKDKCNVTVAVNNKLMRSGDCSRTYKQVFIDQSTRVIMRSVITHPVNSALMFAGSSNGNVLQSQNSGKTWTSIHRFEKAPITQLLVQPDDVNVLYALVEKKGIFKSADLGATWIDITPAFKTYRNAKDVKNMVWDKTHGLLFLTSKYGILTTANGGDSWDDLELLTGPSEANITAIAINPSNAQQIMYATSQGTASNIYASADGGKTWGSAPAPTTRQISNIMFDPEASHIIYLSAFATQQ